jgi:hypothetical protein
VVSFVPFNCKLFRPEFDVLDPADYATFLLAACSNNSWMKGWYGLACWAARGGVVRAIGGDADGDEVLGAAGSGPSTAAGALPFLPQFVL